MERLNQNRKLTLGFSSCPNDTFIFDALVNQRIETGDYSFDLTVSDVEDLNTLAMNGALDITKVSYAAYLRLVKDYVLLDSGSALGRGCGPLLIANKPISGDMSELTVAIPGLFTTANLLLGYAYPQITRKKVMVFSEIEDAVIHGEVDLGLIIHESRFTYVFRGLKKIADLGEIWEQRTGLPIPLGGIIAKRNLGLETLLSVNTMIRQSLEYSFAHPGEANTYIKSLAQETDDAIIQQHIDLYVNEYTLSLGTEGRDAVETLFSYAAGAGLIDVVPEDIFLLQ